MPPSAIDRHVGRAAGFDAFHDRGELRYADARYHPRRADRARPDPDLDGVGAGIDQRLCALCRRDIAGHHLGDVAQPACTVRRPSRTRSEWPCAVSTTSTSTPASSRASARSSPASPTPVAAATRNRPCSSLQALGWRCGLVDILDRDQAGADTVLVHHQQLLDPVLVQQALGFGPVDRFGHGDQIFAGHQLAHRLLRNVGEAHIPVGDDPGQPPVAALDHRNAGYPMTVHQVQHVGKGSVRRDRDRVHHHARFVFLDLADFACLVRRLHILVQDADAAGLGHGNGELVFRDRIHGGRDERNAQADRPCEPGAGLGLCRQDGRPAGLQQDVVEGQRLGDGRDRRGGGDGHAVRACALCKIETIAGRMADADCPTCLTTNPQPRKAACGAGRESRGQPLLTMPAVSATAFSRSALR